jgi:hypothetical protein
VGDVPEEAELVDIEGSCKAFGDYAKPVILMHAVSRVGDICRQETALGDAEDVAEMLSVTSSQSVPVASCDGDYLVTMDVTPLEPEVFEDKCYAPLSGSSSRSIRKPASGSSSSR